jgi:hypothetical protein
MSGYLDRIASAIRDVELSADSDTSEGALWSLNYSNHLPGLGEAKPDWLLPTHHAWGKTDDGDYTSEAQQHILSAITDIIASAEVVADISSLATVADGAFRQAIIEGARLAQEAGRRPLIRMLWGKTIVKSFIDGDYKSIGKLVQDINRVAPDIPVVAALTNFKEIGHEKSWNHSKIVAADGRIAMVGGMNLWAQDYLQKAPITDLSIRVQGPAAAAAQTFLNELWAYVESYGSQMIRPDFTLTLTPTYVQQVNLDSNNYVVPIPLDQNANSLAQDDISILAVGRAGFWKNGRVTRSTERTVSDEDYKFSSGLLWDKISGGGIMNQGNPGWDANNPGDIALRSLVSLAEDEILVTQQMLETKFINVGRPVFDFRLFRALANKILDGVDVTIVTSNINVNGDYKANHPQQSWNTLAALVYRSLQQSADYISLSASEKLQIVKKVMQDNLAIKGLRLSESDTWPGQSKNPGLHSKIVAVDDSAFYVGSQNAYPNQLPEYGYIVESKTASADLNRTYLDPLNRFSKEFDIDYNADFVSLLPQRFQIGGGSTSFNGDGADYRVKGSDADDLLRGGSGQDHLTGGDGGDVFLYVEASDSPSGKSRRDVIRDYNITEDKLDLSAIDFNLIAAGHQDATFIGLEPFSGQAGELRLAERGNHLLLRTDLDGDSGADFAIKLKNVEYSPMILNSLEGVEYDVHRYLSFSGGGWNSHSLLTGAFRGALQSHGDDLVSLL